MAFLDNIMSIVFFENSIMKRLLGKGKTGSVEEPAEG